MLAPSTMLAPLRSTIARSGLPAEINEPVRLPCHREHGHEHADDGRDADDDDDRGAEPLRNAL